MQVSEHVLAHHVWERDIVESFETAARRVSKVSHVLSSLEAWGVQALLCPNVKTVDADGLCCVFKSGQKYANLRPLLHGPWYVVLKHTGLLYVHI